MSLNELILKVFGWEESVWLIYGRFLFQAERFKANLGLMLRKWVPGYAWFIDVGRIYFNGMGQDGR